MNNIVHTLLLVIIMSVTSSNLMYSVEKDDFTTFNLHPLDFSGDSIMTQILEDVTDNVKYGSHPAPCTVNMSKYKDGILLCIYRTQNDVFDRRRDPIGYTIVNNCFMVFASPYFANTYNYKFLDNEESKIISGTYTDFKDRIESKYYYILGDVYARFSPEAGWIWSDSKPDE